LPSSPKGEIVGIMAKVLSLMATHTGDGSQYNRSVAEIDEYNRSVAKIDDQLSNNEENKRFAGTPFKRCGPAGMPLIQCGHTHRYTVQKVRTPSSHILCSEKVLTHGKSDGGP